MASRPVLTNKNRLMKHLFAILSMLLVTMTTNAQTFTDHLKQKQSGQGTVTVIQSKDIDELVNGTSNAQTSPKNTVKNPASQGQQPANNNQQKQPSAAAGNLNSQNEAGKKEETHKDELSKIEANKRVEEERNDENQMDIPSVDMRKKVMRKSYKVDGYRVQAFAGGNTRADRQKAENIRTAIKMKFPNQPVYVHFYSPRWICRVGNYRSYEEADWMLKELKKMGYRSAIIVKGKITVQY